MHSYFAQYGCTMNQDFPLYFEMLNLEIHFLFIPFVFGVCVLGFFFFNGVFLLSVVLLLESRLCFLLSCFSLQTRGRRHRSGGFLR